MSELKPCPCGSQDLALKENEHWSEVTSVCCLDCTFSAALEDWNTRPPVQDCAEEMAEMLGLAISYMDGDSIEDFTYHYQEISRLLAKARGEL